MSAQATPQAMSAATPQAPEPAPTISPARYAKGKVVMYCPSNDSGLKTRAMCLAEAFGGRYVHRSHGYVMAPGSAAKALDHWQRGYDAHIRMFASDRKRGKELLIPPRNSQESSE